MKKLLAGALAGVVSFAVTRKLTKENEEAEEKPQQQFSGLVWISADDVEDEGPLFEVGDSVVTYNPYTMDYAIVDMDFTPLYFKIENYKFDEKDGEYRYKLHGEDKWYAESWLMKPMAPFMTKKLRQEAPKVEEGEGESKTLQIDYWLLTLHEAVEAGDEKERKIAEEALRDLTGGEGV